MGILVYLYGLKAPTENADLVKQQMLAAHKYRNTLTEIERGRRAALRKLYGALGDEGSLEALLQSAEDSVEAGENEIKQVRASLHKAHLQKGESTARAKSGSRVTPKDLAEKLKLAKDARHSARAALFEYRNKVRKDPNFVLEAERINGLANELVKSAREHCGVFWGSYLLVEDAMGAASKSPLYDGALPNDPEFESWTPSKRAVLGDVLEGTVGVQIQEHTDTSADFVVGYDVRAVKDGTLSGSVVRKGLRGTVVTSKVDTVELALANGQRVTGSHDEVRALFKVVKDVFTCKQAFGTDSRLQIERIPDRWNRPNREWANLKLRVGSTPDRKPIFASWPMKLHRPLPENGVIKRVNVSYRPVGPGHRHEWVATFIVDQEGPATRSRGRGPVVVRHGGKGAVAVNLGWRWMGEELRVATWRSDTGKTGDIRLTADMVSDLRFSETIRSRRDKEFNQARDILADWVFGGAVAPAHVPAPPAEYAMFEAATHNRMFTSTAGVVPDWLREECKTLASWKSSVRLMALVERWMRERKISTPKYHDFFSTYVTFWGDEPRRGGDGKNFDGLDHSSEAWMWACLEAWRYHDRHLWEWETEQRERALNRRKEVYRNIAAILSTNFKTLVIEDFDLSTVARRASVTGPWQNELAASNRQLVAPSELRDTLKRAFTNRGEVVEVLSTDNTRTCRNCGTVEDFDAGTSAVRSAPCSGCGAVWDQDENNCAVQLAQYTKMKESLKTDTKTESGETRWERVKRKKEEKNIVGNAAP